MLQNAAITSDGIQRRDKTTSIVARSIVLAAVALEIQMSEVRPKLAGRVSNHWMGPLVRPGVPRLIPRIDAFNSEVVTVCLDE